MTYYMDKEISIADGNGWRCRMFVEDEVTLNIQYEEWDTEAKAYKPFVYHLAIGLDGVPLLIEAIQELTGSKPTSTDQGGQITK